MLLIKNANLDGEPAKSLIFSSVMTENTRKLPGTSKHPPGSKLSMPLV